ncbi:MAG: hypothetical protein RLZ35_709 [Pseudomonadota bacterium]|jgi:hypothetical protein
MLKSHCKHHINRLFLSVCCFFGWATVATADNVESLADIAGNLIFGASIVTDFLHVVSIILGVGFMIYSVVAYRNHRLNPKMVPLDRPILYLFLGIVFTAIPFLGTILERTTGEIAVRKYQNNTSGIHRHHDIDSPDTHSHHDQTHSRYYANDIDAPLDDY